MELDPALNFFFTDKPKRPAVLGDVDVVAGGKIQALRNLVQVLEFFRHCWRQLKRIGRLEIPVLSDVQDHPIVADEHRVARHPDHSFDEFPRFTLYRKGDHVVAVDRVSFLD